MQITTERIALTKRHALTISRGTISGSENVFVTVAHDGFTGTGEMAPSDVTGDTAESAVAALEEWSGPLGTLSPGDLQHVEQVLGPVPTQGSAMRAALDLACHDWLGRRVGAPLWKLWGLDRSRIAPTSLTVGLNPPEVVREVTTEILTRTKARVLKIKLGSKDGLDADRGVLVAAQEAAHEVVGDGIIWRVDANGGWTLAQACEMLPWLAERNVELVEQPLAQGDEDSLASLFAHAPLPIFVDESIRFAADIPALADRVHGVNFKLMKCGGLRHAMRIVHVARAHNLQVMIGCMGETSLAISAGSQIAPLLDCIDLDSHLNLVDDPFVGATFGSDGRVVPTAGAGLGAERR